LSLPLSCGSEGWDEIEDFGHSKLDSPRQYGNFTGGIPSHVTLARVIALINADQLQTAFSEWMKACHNVTEGAVVAIDGKTLLGSYCRGKGKDAIHMVSAFSAANCAVSGQVKTAEKSQRNNGDIETAQAFKFTRPLGHHRRHRVS
jgi:hypothetical protein